MLTEGYAAVTTRRVAKQLGLTAGLIHYYFPTTDELLVAVYRRASGQTDERLKKALASAHPIRGLWNVHADAACTGLALEFAALANHRKVIRAELAASFDRSRRMQIDALAKLNLGQGMNLHGPRGLAVFLAGIARLIVMERALGTTRGHAEAKAIVAEWIRRLQREPERRPRAAAKRRRRKAKAAA